METVEMMGPFDPEKEAGKPKKPFIRKEFIRNVVTRLSLAALIIILVMTYFDQYVHDPAQKQQIIELRHQLVEANQEKIKAIKSAIIIYEQQQEKEKENKILKVVEQLQPRLDPTILDDLVKAVISESKKKNLDPYTILGLIFVESSIDPLKESNKNAVGFMQVRFPTWKEQPELISNGVDKKYKLFWTKENIKCGTDIFTKFDKEANYDITKTLYRYNSGSAELPKDISRFDIEYVNKILYYTYKIRRLVEYHVVDDKKTENTPSD